MGKKFNEGNTIMANSPSHHHNESWLLSRTGIATVAVVAVLGFLLYTGHSAHLLGALPYLFILACPLMHIFMHGGHHGHHRHDVGDKESSGGCCGGRSKGDNTLTTHTDGGVR